MRKIRYLYPWRGNNKGDVREVPIGSLASAKWLVDRKMAEWVDPIQPPAAQAEPEPPVVLQVPDPEPENKALAAPPQDKMVSEPEKTKTTKWGKRGRKNRN